MIQEIVVYMVYMEFDIDYWKLQILRDNLNFAITNHMLIKG